MRRFIVLTAVLLCLASVAFAQVSYEGYADPMDLVDHWYQTFLHRSGRADPGSSGWVQQLQQGSPPNAVLAGILSSDEYYGDAGGTPQGFITKLYTDSLGRQPSPGELQYWMQRALTQNISDMETRKDIAYDILTNNPGNPQGSYETPPVLPAQPWYNGDRERERERERQREHERHENDYHRPHYPYRH